MREIKFRATIKNKNSGYDIILFTLQDLINPKFSIRELVIPWIQSGGVADQFTGLKDKNGKDVFEGDIVTNISKDYFIHLDHALREGEMYCIDSLSEFFMSLGLSEFEMCAPFESKYIQIIGNKFENPELLEQSDGS